MSSVFGLGGGVGLVLSGVIVEHLNWHALFLIGAVPVLISTLLIARFVPESKTKTPSKPDYPGAVALSVGFASLLLALSEGTTWGWTSPGVLGLLALAATALAGWVQIERRVEDPLVDLPTLIRPGMAATNATTVLVGFSMTAFFVLVPGFLQSAEFGFALSPTEIGAQIAAALVSAHPGTGDGYTLAFAMGALGLLAALAPTLLLDRRRAVVEPAYA